MMKNIKAIETERVRQAMSRLNSIGQETIPGDASVRADNAETLGNNYMMLETLHKFEKNLKISEENYNTSSSEFKISSPYMISQNFDTSSPIKNSSIIKMP